MEAFKEVCREAACRIACNPPAMDEIWEDGVKGDLTRAAAVALEAGASPAAMYTAVDKARPEGECFPLRLERMLLEQGLHPDTMLPTGRCLLLHKLHGTYPPPVNVSSDGEVGEDPDEDGDIGPGISLAELLQKGPNTSLTDENGNTALHLLVHRCLDREYFPDLPGHLIFSVGDPSDLFRDDDRADYLKEAFAALLQAGYRADAVDGRGKTAMSLLKEGYARYSSEVRQHSRDALTRGLKDMQMAIRDCLQLLGEAVS